MKKAIIVLLLFCSCSTTKKTSHTKAVTADTMHVTAVEAIHVARKDTDNFSMKGLSIDVYYNNDTSAAVEAMAEAVSKPADRSTPHTRVQELFNAFPNHSAITRIHISADTVAEAKTATTDIDKKKQVDSGSGHHIDAVADNSSKTTRWPAWIYIGGILLILAAIYGLLKRFKILP